jgi:hypothetical protein
MNKYINTLSVIATIFLFGCSNRINYEKNINSFIADQKLAPMESIDTGGAIKYRALNDKHIALTIQNSGSYLLTVPANCQDIMNATKIVLATAAEGVVQVNSRDKIVRIGDKYSECLVSGLYKLHSEQLEQLVSWSYRRDPSWSNNLIYPLFYDAKSRGLEN